MKLVAQDIPVIAKRRIHHQEQGKTQKVAVGVMVIGGLGFGAQIYAPAYSTIGLGVGAIALGFFYWYTTKLDKKVKAYASQLMAEWQAEKHD